MGKLRLKVVRLFFSLFSLEAFTGFDGGEERRGIQKRTALSKGNQVNIPEPGCGYWGASKTLQPFFSVTGGEGVLCGNANEFGDASGSPGKSYLFFLTVH